MTNAVLVAYVFVTVDVTFVVEYTTRMTLIAYRTISMLLSDSPCSLVSRFSSSEASRIGLDEAKGHIAGGAAVASILCQI